jgi:hypothetical protein
MNVVMDMVEQIQHQLANGSLSRLSSLIGATEGETRSAVKAAVPAVLSALSGMVSSSGGAQKLASALGHFETGPLAHVSEMLSAQPSTVLEQGNGILNSLFGGNTVSGIVNALTRFAGFGAGSAQKLLAYVMPLIMGAIAARFPGKAVNPQSLASLLADQKTNIANALPSGFSLSDVPGLTAGREAARAVGDAIQPAATNVWRWLLPVLCVLALAAILLWYFFGRPTPKVGDFAQLNTDLTGTFKSLTDSLTSIKDVASAETALPKLRDLEGKLDGMKALVEKLPDADKTKITDLIKTDLGKCADQFVKLLWIPGVAEKIRPTADGIMARLSALGGLPASKVCDVSADLAGTLASLNNSLIDIKDSGSAEGAVAKLKDIGEKLDSAKSALQALPESGRSAILEQLKAALSKVKELVAKVLTMPVVGDKVKPALDAVMGKLHALVA